jgi:transcriptional regulator with XRE-family HTH domain
MAAIIADMKLRVLLARDSEIRSLADLRKALPDMSRQQVWMIWHGKTTLGLRIAKRISQVSGIPLDELAEVDEAVKGEPRQRKPKSPPP